MHHQLNTFSFEGKDVRVIVLDGEPWFVASDVATTLGYVNPRRAILAHCKGSNETVLPSAGGPQAVKIIREGDVFRLILRSKLPTAQAFEAKVVEEILPAIRKTGSYSVRSLSPAELLLSQAQVLVNHEREIQTLQTRVAAIEAKTEEAEAALGAMPEPLVHPADLTTRAKVNRLVRDFVFKHNADHKNTWNWVYREFRDRYHVDLKARAAARGLKPLEVAELEGHLEDLYACAYQMFRTAAA